MKKYVLLGAYNPYNSEGYIKIIHTSDDVEQLKNIWKTIDEFYLEMEKTFDGGLSERALKMIQKNNYLNNLFESFFDATLWTIQVVGIFETVKVKPVYSHLIKCEIN